MVFRGGVPVSDCVCSAFTDALTDLPNMSYFRSIAKDNLLKWLEEGKFDMSITPSKIYIVADNAKAYGAAYNGGRLTSIVMQDIVDYAVIELEMIDLNMINADTVSLFVWDENQAPLCGKISFNIGG